MKEAMYFQLADQEIVGENIVAKAKGTGWI